MNNKLTKMASLILAFLFIFNFSVTSAQAATTDNTASDNYQKAKTEWQKKLQEIKEKKQQVTETTKKENLTKAKTMVTKAIDRAVAHLQRIIKRIQSSKVITEERKTKLIADLNVQITALKDLKTQVEAVTTKEELKTVVGDVKNKFVEIRTLVKKIVAEILASHIDKVIVKLNTIVTKLETEIADLKTKGQDVTEFETALTEAKTLLTQATDKNKAGDFKEARKLAEQARAKLAKLAGQIKAAKAKLKGGEGASE